MGSKKATLAELSTPKGIHGVAWRRYRFWVNLGEVTAHARLGRSRFALCKAPLAPTACLNIRLHPVCRVCLTLLNDPENPAQYVGGLGTDE